MNTLYYCLLLPSTHRWTSVHVGWNRVAYSNLLRALVNKSKRSADLEGPPEVHLRPLVAASVVRRPGSALYLLVFHVRPGNGSRVTDANRAPRPQGSRNGETSPCGLIGGHGRPMRPLRVALRNISDGRQRVKGGARRPF